jgi:hypothetical protein
MRFSKTKAKRASTAAVIFTAICTSHRFGRLFTSNVSQPANSFIPGQVKND